MEIHVICIQDFWINTSTNSLRFYCFSLDTDPICFKEMNLKSSGFFQNHFSVFFIVCMMLLAYRISSNSEETYLYDILHILC